MSMYTQPAKVTVPTKTLISVFEKGEVKTLDAEEVEVAKPVHPELVRDELAEPGTAKKLLLAFESKRQEGQNATLSSLKSPTATGRLSLEKFASFEDKTVKVTVEKQTNGFVNGNGDVSTETVTVKVEKTEVTVDSNSREADSEIQVEKKVVEISVTNGNEKLLQIEQSTATASIPDAAVETKIEEAIKQKVVEEVAERVEEKLETNVNHAAQEIVEEKIEAKLEEKIEERIEEKIETALEVTQNASVNSVNVEVVTASDVKEEIAERIEENITEQVKEIVAEKVEEKVQEKLEEKVEQMVKENVQEAIEEKVIKKIDVEDNQAAAVVIKTTEVTVEVKPAIETRQSKIAFIVSAVKPEGGIDKALRYASMKTLEDQGHQVIYTDAHNVQRNQRGAPDFEEERKKLIQADLVILHFRPILNSPPAALKLWLEGTLIQGDGKFIDKELLKGKKAIILVTTDLEKVPDERLLSLPFLAAVQDDILRAIALDVISPFIIFGVGQELDETAQKDHLAAWEKRLAAAFV